MFIVIVEIFFAYFKYWPNYYEKKNSNQRLVTPQSIYNQEYIYFGGKKGYSLKLLIHFTSLFLRLYSGFENFQHSFNLSMKKYCALAPDMELVSICVIPEVFVTF
jgi:hypothetical protein